MMITATMNITTRNTIRGINTGISTMTIGKTILNVILETSNIINVWSLEENAKFPQKFTRSRQLFVDHLKVFMPKENIFIPVLRVTIYIMCLYGPKISIHLYNDIKEKFILMIKYFSRLPQNTSFILLLPFI